MAYLAGENNILNTCASRLVGIIVIIIVRWLPKASFREVILEIRVSRSSDIFDAVHRLFYLATSLTCETSIFIVRVEMTLLKRFVLRSLHLALMAISEDRTTLTRQAKFGWCRFGGEDDILGAWLNLLEGTTRYGYHHPKDHLPGPPQALALVG